MAHVGGMGLELLLVKYGVTNSNLSSASETSLPQALCA